MIITLVSPGYHPAPYLMLDALRRHVCRRLRCGKHQDDGREHVTDHGLFVVTDENLGTNQHSTRVSKSSVLF